MNCEFCKTESIETSVFIPSKLNVWNKSNTFTYDDGEEFKICLHCLKDALSQHPELGKRIITRLRNHKKYLAKYDTKNINHRA